LLIERYLSDPKPVLWRGGFQAKAGETARKTVARCYPHLIAARRQSYAALAHAIEPAWVSDHLCWGSAHGIYAHDLLPVAYTEESLAHVARRVQAVQERLGRRMLLENPSTYMQLAGNEMSEWDFLGELARRADCGILLDVNNVFVSAHNHGFDARDYLGALPPERIGQIHLAGHSCDGDLLIDTHDNQVCDEVWTLYADTIAAIGARATMIEWDAQVPAFDVLKGELARAAEWGARGLARRGEPRPPRKGRRDAA